jgi:hypothetical protein
LCRFFVSSTGSARPVRGVLDQLPGDPATHPENHPGDGNIWFGWPSNF